MPRPAFLITMLASMLFMACADQGTTPASGPVTVTDAELFAMQAAPDGWTWFGLTPDTLTGGSTTAHEPRIRVRYNRHAASRLTPAGRVAAGAVFPDSSLIVKDLYTGTTRTTVAYMFKLSAAANASASGWVWAETDGNGATKISADTRGAGCVGCHAPGIDFTRMNDAHP